MLDTTAKQHVENVIRSRRSIRAFRSDPVAEEILRSMFTVANAAPSNSNIQPWEVEVVSGDTRDRLSADLLAAHRAGRMSPDFPVTEDKYTGKHQTRAFNTGAAVYGAMGIGRGDTDGRKELAEQNFKFYGAPHAALIFMPADAEARMAGDVGIYAQTLMLVMAANGIGSCPQGFLGYYAETVRQSLGIEDKKLLFGLSFGYPDTEAPVNNVVIPRADLTETTRFHN